MKFSNVTLTPLLLFAGMLVVVLAVVLAIKIRRIMTSNDPLAFERQRLSLIPENRDYILGYLKVARRFRISGTLVGLLIGIIASEAGPSGAVLLSTNWFFTSIAGYFVGALVGAWKSGMSSTGTERTASLTVRSRNDFVSEWFIKATYIAAGGSVAFFAASLFERSGTATEGVGVRWLVMASALTVAAVTDLGTRRLVQASRPSANEDVMSAFNAITRASSSAVATAGLSLSLWLLSCSALSARPTTGQSFFSIVCILVGIAMLFASGTVWFAARRGEWRQELALRA